MMIYLCHLKLNVIMRFSSDRNVTPWRFESVIFWSWVHYCDVIIGAVASQITSLTIVYSTVYSDADQRKHQSSASLAFVWGIRRGPVNSPHKWPVTRKMSPFDDVIMLFQSFRQATNATSKLTNWVYGLSCMGPMCPNKLMNWIELNWVSSQRTSSQRTMREQSIHGLGVTYKKIYN